MATIQATAKSVYFTMHWNYRGIKPRPQTISLGDLRLWHRANKNIWKKNEQLVECVRLGLVVKVKKSEPSRA
jgi:hypothetical protein